MVIYRWSWKCFPEWKTVKRRVQFSIPQISWTNATIFSCITMLILVKKYFYFHVPTYHKEWTLRFGVEWRSLFWSHLKRRMIDAYCWLECLNWQTLKYIRIWTRDIGSAFCFSRMGEYVLLYHYDILPLIYENICGFLVCVLILILNILIHRYSSEDLKLFAGRPSKLPNEKYHSC